MSTSQPRFWSLFFSVALFAPTLGLLVAPTAAAEESEDIRVVAVYDDFAYVPANGYFLSLGLTPGYRFVAIPAIILSGQASAVQDLSSDGNLDQIVYDEPLLFHLETAVVASNARDVWGTTWHAQSGVPPMLKGGLPLDGRGVTVGIVDSGANAAHPDLWYAPLAIAPGITPAPKIKACVHTTGIAGPAITVPVINCDENVGHGTHVAGIVAGTGMMADMGFTVSGMAEYNGAAPGASLVVAGLGVETIALGGLIIDGLAGLDYMYDTADEFGTRVVTNSWSSALGCTGSWNRDSDVYHAITNKLVQDKGITVLWAANNDGGTRPIGTSPQGRNAMPGVIMVANYDDKGTGTRDGDIALSSGDGCVKTGGATSDMIWTWPDVAAPGSNIVSTASGIDGLLGMAPIFVGSTPADAPFYATLSGTSMATPHVAGVAALLYQAYPEITPAQVESILIKTAKPWSDGVTNRGVTGTAAYWGPTAVNNAVAGFADPTLCKITPALAARAEANDPTLDALYPNFRDLVQPRLVNGQVVDADATNYVCRDFKRGAGLIDAEAAVLEALRLADGGGGGLPEITIDVPVADAVITDAQMLVKGLVDRDGAGPNLPPTATLAADVTTGPAPLTVGFSLAGADDDGTIASFSLDFGDGSAPLAGTTLPTGTQSHSYASDGEYTATLTVTDNDGASGDASVTISVGGLPSSNPDVTGSMFAYNHISDTPSGSPVNVPCPGVSNIIALGASTATTTDVPPMYAPASKVCLQARSVGSADPDTPVSLASGVNVRWFDADGDLVAGPTAATVFAEVDSLGNPNGRFGFRAPNFVFPADWSGRYYLAFAVDSPAGPQYVHDTTYDGLKPIDIIGPDMLGVPGLPGSDPGSDEGHSIGDADDDGVTPYGEIQWVDTSVDADSLSIVMRMAGIPPQPEGASATLYAIFVNGVEFESYLYGVGWGGARLYDATNNVQVIDATTEWDTAESVVTVDIPRSYIASVTSDCPCVGHVEAQAGPPFLGDQPMVDRAPNVGSRELRAPWQLGIVSGGTDGSSADPENSDPAGDPLINLPDPAPDVPVPPHVDVRKIWISRETATEIDVTLAITDLASSPPAVDVGLAKAATTYGTEFCVNNAAQTYTPASGNYAGVSGRVCYRLGASNGVLGVQHSGGVIQKDGSASCGLTGITKAAVFNTAASTITWTIDLTGLNVDTIGAALAQCSAVTRAATAPTSGNIVSRLVGSSGTTAGALVTGTITLDNMVAANARDYTLGGTVPPLVAEAGAGYTGNVGDSIAITGSATGGTLPYACSWASPEGAFANANACATSVVFTSAGLKSITLTVTDGAGGSAIDTATVDVISDAVEHVEVVVGGVRTSTFVVSTSEDEPTAEWSVIVDVAGLPEGETDIVATWYDTDGTTILASATRTVTLDLDAVTAFVDILSPADGSGVSGVSTVSGIAGHTGGSGGEGSGLNHYGFPIWSGIGGARASVTLSGNILTPCGTCQPGQLSKPVAAIPNAAWAPIENNVGPIANPILFDNLGTNAAWLAGPNSDAQGVDGFWFNIAGHGGDEFELTDEFDVEVDVRFYNDWLDPQSAELGGANGPTMPKTGTVPAAANWAFTYVRKGTTDTVANQWGSIPTLELTPTIVPPGAVQALAATSGPGTVALSWAPPIADGGELLGYKVLRDGTLLDTVEAPGFVDTPGDTATHVYAVIPFNSAGDGPSSAVSASAGEPTANLAITNPLDGAVAVPATTTIDGTFTPGGSTPPPSGAFANTHYVALMNLNSPCGGNLGYGDHVIMDKLIDHAIDVLGVPANNIHIYNEGGVALTSSIDSSHFAQLSSDWKDGSIFDGPARWSVFQPALRTIAETAAAGEAAGGPPARIFFLETSHGLQASLVLGDGATDSMFCLMDVDVSSTMLGDLLNDIDADVAAAHPGVAIEWSINIDCSFCGGFADSPLPAPATTPAFTAGVVGPNRVIEVGCTWVTECFGNPAVTYDYMFNECVFTGKADGYGPVLTTVPGSGTDGGDAGYEILVGSATYADPDGVITLEESYWCAIETAHASINDPIAIQQMFQISDNLAADMFGLEGFPLWEKDSSLDLSTQDPDAPLNTVGLALPDVRATDPEADAQTAFADLTSLEASATATDVFSTLGVADLTISSLEAEDVVEYRLVVNGDRFGACYSLGSVLLYGYDLDGGDGGVSSGTAVYDVANGLVAFRIPRAELNDQTLPATVYASSHYGECTVIMPVEDDRVPDAGEILTSDDDTTTPPVGADKITVSLSGPATISGDATLDLAAGTWTFDPAGQLADGLWTATATQYFDDGGGFAQVGAPVSIQFTVGVGGDIEAPTAPGTPVATSTTTSSISIAWTASTDNVGVDHYEVFRNGGSQGTTTGTTFTDTGLAAGTTYTYAVTAFDAAGNSATSGELSASTDDTTSPTGTVIVRVGSTLLGSATIDLSGGDPASWSIDVDWAGAPEGTIQLVADYDDGQGMSASDMITLVVDHGVTIAITDPAAGANVLPTFTVSGTVEGAGGPDGVDSSTFLFPDGKLDELNPGYMLASTTNVLTTLDAALANEEGYLGVAPSMAGDLTVRAYFSGDAPSEPTTALPAGWTLEMVEDVELERAIDIFHGELPISRVRDGPPAPAQAIGIGPGSHLLMTMRYAPGFTFACTANFVWKDTAGNYYLGAAGHCFLPNPIPGGPQGDAVATHGPGADYDPADTSIRVCVSNCQFGGQAGFLLQGVTVPLGNPTYARQTGPGGDVGNDFGIVKIPTSLLGQTRPELPVWNGPTTEGTLSVGEPALLYGNAAGFGEVWPTMARAGLGGASQTATRWSAVLPSFQGDSGSALVSAQVSAPDDEVLEGFEAVGVLTHLVVGTGGPVAGTTMSRAKGMATEAGLTIVPVLQGEAITPPTPTPPSAPTLQSLSPGTTSMGLTWTTPTNDGGAAITGYTIRYGTASGTYTSTQTVGVVTSATVTDLAPATTYYFVVSATNSAGTSVNSNELDAATQAIPTPPGVPRNVVAAPDNAAVIVGWDAPESDGGAPVTSYTVAYTGGPAGSVTVAGNVFTTTVTGLTNGVEYAFTVTATNSAGTGEASAPVTATPNGPTPPAFTVELRADAGGVEVVPWTLVESFDGSSFSIELANMPGGALDVTARVLQDGVPVGSYAVSVHVLSAPVLTVPASVDGNELEEVAFTASASDADGPAGLAFTLVDAPEGATIGAASGEFSWTPQYDDAGVHTIAIRVTDPDGLTDEESVTLNIGAVNRPPVLDPIGNKVVGESQTLTFTLTASDHENDALTFSASGLPTGANFDPSTATFTWTPAFGEEGNYPATFGVTDGLASDSETITISVGNVNRPPVLDPIGPQAGAENALLLISVGGSDPDEGSFLSTSASGLPAGATFAGGLFAWTPGFNAEGMYTVTFVISDGELVDTEEVVITIANTDRAPFLAIIATGSAVQTSTVTVPLRATDPDGDAISWSVNGPDGASIVDLGGGNARLVWTPSLSQLGPYTFTVAATAGELVTTRTTVLTAIFKADVATAAASPTNVQAYPGQVLAFTTTVTNTGPHADTFRISASNSGGLAVTNVPAPITLGPGESADVTVRVTASAAKPLTTTSVTATSLGDGTTSKTTTFRYDIPVLLTMSVAKLRAADLTVTDLPRGVVHVTYSNGVAAPGASVSITQNGMLISPVYSTVSGTTNAAGDFAFDFTQTWGALVPGRHTLAASGKLPGAFASSAAGEYFIGLRS